MRVIKNKRIILERERDEVVERVCLSCKKSERPHTHYEWTEKIDAKLMELADEEMRVRTEK